MSRTSFEVFGHLAKSSLSPLEIAGRLPAQAESERLMPLDIAQKLELVPTDSLLDVGCGPGNNLIPLSYFVRSVTGVDHPDTIKYLSSRIKRDNVDLVGGNFLDVEISSRFTKILIYSVIQCLESEEEALAFLKRACDLLEPGGRLLVGDMSNSDLRRKFQASERGMQFQKEWVRRTAAAAPRSDMVSFAADTKVFSIDDASVLRLMRHFRTESTHAWILPQSPALPFGHTREDLLIVKF